MSEHERTTDSYVPDLQDVLRLNPARLAPKELSAVMTTLAQLPQLFITDVDAGWMTYSRRRRPTKAAAPADAERAIHDADAEP